MPTLKYQRLKSHVYRCYFLTGWPKSADMKLILKYMQTVELGSNKL